jgi:exonuclease SbcD
MIKLIHTADWHLGHKLHDVDRRAEHEGFLTWLVETVHEREADGLLVCGDVFDAANPSAEAQEQWYRFLATCRRENPDVDIVVIGGNHDSAGRLDAPNPLFRELGVQIVGGLPRQGRDVLIDNVLKPVTDRDGNIAAWVAAVPFLRAPDLPLVEAEDPLIAGVRDLYRRILDKAREKAGGHCAVIAMGHLYLSGTSLSELSERKVLGGNQHALPVETFPEDVTYVALGHLHLAQEVGRETVRYSGAPLPMSIPERSYSHQIVEVELDGAHVAGITCIPVPQTRGILRIPDVGALTVDDLLAELARLPGADGAEGKPPLLEAAARLERPEPGLRNEVESALADKHARLVTLTVELTGHGRALADDDHAAGLADIEPEQVFRLAWNKSYAEEPDPEFLEAFHDLVDQVMQEDER